MKAVFKQPIAIKLDNLIKDLKLANRIKDLEYILITKEERKELVEFLFSSIDYAYWTNRKTKQELLDCKYFEYSGYKIKVED